MMLNKKDIEDFCKKNDIEYLAIFGSYARGDFREESDIDVLVKFNKRKSLLDLVRMERELSRIMNRKVDLLTENSISKYLRDIIKRELVVVYEG
jgi:hypothetical protein